MLEYYCVYSRKYSKEMRSLKVSRYLAFGMFILASVGNLAGKFIGGHILSMCTKPLIVPSLALFCWLLLRENDVRGRRGTTLMLAMAFGTLGDVLLMFSGQVCFLAGLFAFLIGHLCYLCTIPFPDKNGRKRIFSIALFALLITIMCIASQFFAVKGFMGMCVTAYACVFAFVIHAGIMAAIDTKNRLYVMTVAGYILFVVSDTILATGVFTDIRIPMRGFWVMLTYIFAQLLIAVSLTFVEIENRKEFNSKQIDNYSENC